VDKELRTDIVNLVKCLESKKIEPRPKKPLPTLGSIDSALLQRVESMSKSIQATIHDLAGRQVVGDGGNTTVVGNQLLEILGVLLRWMRQGTVVRVFGAGRARLAAAIPANRLIHGGARTFMQGDIIPMPHTIHGGAVLAASASGETPSVLADVAAIRRYAPHIKILGIASAEAKEFCALCDYFIGIRESPNDNPLKALADVKEYVISEVLDALVVAAGKLGGFDDRRWRLGHENVGATGPYDAIRRFHQMFNIE
jgi:D-arabinose 5-phosphate isomerase GutQ